MESDALIVSNGRSYEDNQIREWWAFRGGDTFSRSLLRGVGRHGRGNGRIRGVHQRSGRNGRPAGDAQLRRGVKVGFFEPNPGDLKVLSWGPNGTEAPITKELVDEGLSATELYAKLSGAEAPDTLVAAQERAHASAVGTPTESEVLNASYQAPTSTGAAPVTGDAASKEQGVYSPATGASPAMIAITPTPPCPSTAEVHST